MFALLFVHKVTNITDNMCLWILKEQSLKNTKILTLSWFPLRHLFFTIFIELKTYFRNIFKKKKNTMTCKYRFFYSSFQPEPLVHFFCSNSNFVDTNRNWSQFNIFKKCSKKEKLVSNSLIVHHFNLDRTTLFYKLNWSSTQSKNFRLI